jgi:hypothetical protein
MTRNSNKPKRKTLKKGNAEGLKKPSVNRTRESKKKFSLSKLINPTIIATLITVVIAIGFFNSADIRFVRQSHDDVCPFEVTNGNFEISFSNQNGNRGTDLFVEVSSPNNIAFLKNNDSMNIPAGRWASLKFLIKASTLKKGYDPIDNVTIDVNASYISDAINTRKSIYWSCKYKKWSSQLLLESYVQKSLLS